MKPIALTLMLALMLSGCGGAKDRAKEGVAGMKALFAAAFGKDGSVEGGGLCGDPLLVGEAIGDIPGPGGCGVENAVRLRSVGHIGLSQPATIECGTAKALKQWLQVAAVPAVGAKGGGIGELRVAAHYACRTRNHKRGARLSEHAKGRAIDISAIHLRDGTQVTVLNDWRSKTYGPDLKTMHSRACGIFGTVLGPGSDGHHEDHFHFDIAQHGNGPYCR